MSLRAARVGPSDDVGFRMMARLGAQGGDTSSGPAASAFLVTFSMAAVSVVRAFAAD